MNGDSPQQGSGSGSGQAGSGQPDLGSPAAGPPAEAAGRSEDERQWQPLTPRQRRVLGVLVEKAKTTPDAYPLTLNALTNGCNQKSNRDPQMSLSPEDVEAALEELRAMGAVAEVQGGSRVSKYRHYVYDWLGVDKVEAAVMTELLLRGEQTLGELRGRAARMEPIADIGALRPIVESLLAKGLVLTLTPPGRGQVVTHALYRPKELEALQHLHARQAAEAESAPPSSPAPPRTTVSADADSLESLRREVALLRGEMDQLRDLVRQLESKLE